MAEVVAYLVERIGPYHKARFDRIAASGSVALHVVEYYRLDDTYAWDVVEGDAGWRRLTLFPSTPRFTGLRGVVRRTIKSIGPDVLMLPGWSDPGALAALCWANQQRVPAVVLADSTPWDAPRVPTIELLKRAIVRRYSGALVAGSPQRDYLASLGMPEPWIYEGYDVVDNKHFESSRSPRDGEYFLCVSRFVEKKNLLRLIEVYADYAARRANCLKLVLAGDGPLMPFVAERVRKLRLESKVRLLGFVQYTELPSIYAKAAAFILLSAVEQWGLVINEAMASGRPIIVSRQCGCARDLVSSENGFVVEPDDRDGIRLAMRAMDDPELRERLGSASKHKITAWGLSRFASSFEQVTQHARRLGAPARSLFADGLLETLASRHGVRRSNLAGLASR